MARTGASGAARVTVVSAALALLLGCVPAAEGGGDRAREALTVPKGQVVLEFDDGLVKRGRPVRRIRSSGPAKVQVTVTRSGGGDVRRAAGRDGFSVRTPARPGRHAVIVVRPQRRDVLSPGLRKFRWGADVALAPRTVRKKAGSNLLQRGHYNDRAQYKLQVDNGVPSCRVKGARGDALVRADEALRPRTWYRLRCHLRQGELVLRVVTAGRPGGQVHRTEARVGRLRFDRGVPVAVAGKVRTDGSLVPRSVEQYHGRLDNVFVAVGRRAGR